MKRVQNSAATFALWKPKERIILAVSGGPDSLCLLDIFSFLSQKYDLELHIAHVNYALRGKDSDLDEKLVRERARLYSIPISVLRPKKTSASNLEEGLRDIRYAFFEKLRKQKKFTTIAVAHHQDDQAETLLLRLLRGSGMSGLSAMRPKNGYIIRPLIEMSRKDILHFLKERHIPYREDKSNTDITFFRNRIRHTLLPLLEKEFQPKIKKILADTALLLGNDYALIEDLATSLQKTNKKNFLEFSCQELLAQPEVLIRHTFRLLLKPSFHGKNPPKGLIDEILKVLKSTKSKAQIVSFRGLKLERKGDTVRLLNFPHNSSR